MAVKYVIDDETLTQIADPLRDLAGRSDELTPAEMAEVGNEATEEVETQSELIDQISAALVGKSAGGGGGVTYAIDNKTLVVENGVLRVNTVNEMQQDNTLPITSAAVYSTVGNIGAILDTI